MTTIGFLHTAAVHAPVFAALVHELAPAARILDRVDPGALEAARTEGVSAMFVRDRIAQHLGALAAAGADVLVCTCSTLGELAEQFAPSLGVPVLRIDRPMVEQACRSGGRIGAVVAVESTVEPTRRLFDDVARSLEVSIDLTVHLCAGAWSAFEAGDQDRYLDAIAGCCDGLASTCDVVVLAQASMAGAVERCRTARTVLRSPASGVRAALALAEGRLSAP